MSPWKEMGRYGFVGVELVTTVAVGFFGGRWLDAHVGARFGGHGYLAWAGLLLGIYAGFHMLVMTARRLQRETERAEEEEENQRRDEEAQKALRARFDEVERAIEDDEVERDDAAKDAAKGEAPKSPRKKTT